MSDQNAGPAPEPGDGPQQPPAVAPAPPLTAAEDKQWGMWAHFGGVLNFIPPLIIWLVFKERGRFTAQEAKESLNFQITMAIVWVAWWIVMAIIGLIPFVGVVLGVFLFPLVSLALLVVQILFPILGGVAVNNGKSYRYPVNFRFIK